MLSPKSALPANAIAIIASVVIACLGFVLFSQRYGEPIREANAAVARVSEIEAKLPGMIAEAAGRADADPDDFRASSRSRLGRRTDPEPTGQDPRLSASEREAMNDATNQRIAALEREIAGLRVSLQQMALSGAAGTASPQTVAPTPQPASADGPPPVNPVPQAADAAPDGVLASFEEEGVRIDVLSAKVSRGQVILNTTVTKMTAGDGHFAIKSDYRDTDRIVTADGIELDKMNAGRTGDYNNQKFSVDLITGVPMRVTLYYRGETVPEPPFLIARAEFTGYFDKARDFPVQVTLENIRVD